MFTSKASLVVLKTKARMQCADPMRHIGMVKKDTSAVCPDVPITAAK